MLSSWSVHPIDPDRPHHTNAQSPHLQNNMLIRPTEEQLADFGEPDFIIYNAGQFPANRFTKGMSSTTSVEINFKRMEMVILGTEYAGEMKKGVFSVMVGLPSSCLHLSQQLTSPSFSTTCSQSSSDSCPSTPLPTLGRTRVTSRSSLDSQALARRPSPPTLTAS